MKKNFKLVLALVLSIMMIAGMIPAMASKTTAHTITIANTDQAVEHTYVGYQIFKGNLDSTGAKLADIEWGDNVDGAKLLTAIAGKFRGDNPATTDVTETDFDLFSAADSAEKVAEVLGKAPFTSTTGDVAGGKIDEFAKAIIDSDPSALKGTPISFTADGTNYTANVTGDGYYLIKDNTAVANLTNSDNKKSDTLSKYMLAVVNDITINAKDTGLTPDKNILKANGQDFTRVKENTAAVGDVVTFEVTIPVPNTKKYIDHFILDMHDTLPAGMTFFGWESIKVGEDTVPTTVTVTEADGKTAFTVPASEAAAVKTTGGQKLYVVFNEFKAFAEAEGKNRIGQNIVIKYKAVVNENAQFGATGNENEVYFEYSNDPNHDYDGDEPDNDDVVGETVHPKTITYVTTLEIKKVDGSNTSTVLEGAEFEITSDDYNMVVETGERFEKAPYTAKTADNETVGSDTYYLLKDGTYTTTAKTTQTAALYEDTSDTYVKVSYTKVVKTPGTTKKITATTGADGLIVLKGLKPGTYKVKETKAPAGYNLDSTEYTLIIDWNNPKASGASQELIDAGGFSIKSGSSDKYSMTSDGVKFAITLLNNSGSTLPSTGGIGTTIFYIGGSILVLAAVILLITKRRMGAND